MSWCARAIFFRPFVWLNFIELSWIKMFLPVQRSILHHEGLHWNQTYHLDHSKEDHRLVLRGALIQNDLTSWCHLKLWCWEKDHHECRKFVPLQLQSREGNRKDQSTFSKHLRFRIFLNIRQRNHKFEWLILTHGFLLRLSIFIYI